MGSSVLSSLRKLIKELPTDEEAGKYGDMEIRGHNAN